ncbi:MAG: hypothetical protein DRN15_03150 [Thermoprotei archaeon]|nr:MAG: hypothetical protein DRM97_04940 [Thermoprotei archaeon]RLF24397.1 MAG: hypothetical protein DRN15_03150 [Thermoprotei archaeon]
MKQASIEGSSRCSKLRLPLYTIHDIYVRGCSKGYEVMNMFTPPSMGYDSRSSGAAVKGP